MGKFQKLGIYPWLGIQYSYTDNMEPVYTLPGMVPWCWLTVSKLGIQNVLVLVLKKSDGWKCNQYICKSGLLPLPPQYSLQGHWLVLPFLLGKKVRASVLSVWGQDVTMWVHLSVTGTQCWVNEHTPDWLSILGLPAVQLLCGYPSHCGCCFISHRPRCLASPQVRAGSCTPSHACCGGSHKHPGTQSQHWLIKASIPPILSGLWWSAGLWNVAASGDRTWRCQEVHVPWTNSDQGCGQQINSSATPPTWTLPVWWRGQFVQRHTRSEQLPVLSWITASSLMNCFVLTCPFKVYLPSAWDSTTKESASNLVCQGASLREGAAIIMLHTLCANNNDQIF